MTHCLGFTPLMVAKNNVLKVDEACLDIALLKDLAQRCPISASSGVNAIVSATTRKSSLTMAFCSRLCDMASPLHKAETV